MSSPVPLGVGQIIRDTFGVFGRNPFKVLLIAIIPAGIGLVISSVVMGFMFEMLMPRPVFGAPDVNLFAHVSVWGSLTVGLLIQVLFFSLVAAFFVQIAHSAALKQQIRLGSYVRPAFRAIVPLFCIGCIATLLITAASFALIIPGLWLIGLFSVSGPSIVIERTGFRGLRRSADLTKGYRWPIVGTLVVMGVCSLMLYAGTGGVVALAAESSVLRSDWGLLVTFLPHVAYGISFGLFAIAIGLIYARLREIKEGPASDEVAEVFD